VFLVTIKEGWQFKVLFFKECGFVDDQFNVHKSEEGIGNIKDEIKARISNIILFRGPSFINQLPVKSLG
jgi:hypothetical protein